MFVSLLSALFMLQWGQGDLRERSGVLVEPYCSSEIAWKLFIQLERLTQSCVFISEKGFSCQAESSRHNSIPRLPMCGCVRALGLHPGSGNDRLQLHGDQGPGSGFGMDVCEHMALWVQGVSLQKQTVEIKYIQEAWLYQAVGILQFLSYLYVCNKCVRGT